MIERVVQQTEATGILPCIKLKREGDFIAYAQAMYDGGARLVEAMIRRRDAARSSRDFAEADRIRDELAASGVLLEDTPQGTVWKRKI